jgi:SpoVK/Ycf46/Vps4 family AAA+-type ATPase
MAVFRKLFELSAKFLDYLDDSNVFTTSQTNSNTICTSCELSNVNYPTVQDIGPYAINSKDSIFDVIVGYKEIKREFVKALNASSPVGVLLCGPPGC